MTGNTADGNAAGPRRLHLNESPRAPPAHVQAAIVAAAQRANRYPDYDTARLYEALARYCDVAEDRLVLTSGSNELLHLLPLIANAGGREMVLSEPSFPTYRKVAEFFGVKVRTAPVREDGVPDIDGVLGAIGADCCLVCVASPNNPTGGVLPDGDVERLAAGVPDHVLLHLDEAYYEFAQQLGCAPTLPLLARRRAPWIVSRSFSKAFSMAGLRIGYAVASDATLAERSRLLRPNFSVNCVAQAAALAALADMDGVRADVAVVAAERERLCAALAGIGLEALPSAANFVAVPVEREQETLPGALAEDGILIGMFALPSGKKALRITVGDAEDTDAVVAAIASKI